MATRVGAGISSPARQAGRPFPSHRSYACSSCIPAPRSDANDTATVKSATHAGPRLQTPLPRPHRRAKNCDERMEALREMLAEWRPGTAGLPAQGGVASAFAEVPRRNGRRHRADGRPRFAETTSGSSAIRSFSRASGSFMTDHADDRQRRPGDDEGVGADQQPTSTRDPVLSTLGCASRGERVSALLQR